jgi:hypothetical protein
MEKQFLIPTAECTNINKKESYFKQWRKVRHILNAALESIVLKTKGFSQHSGFH